MLDSAILSTGDEGHVLRSISHTVILKNTVSDSLFPYYLDTCFSVLSLYSNMLAMYPT